MDRGTILIDSEGARFTYEEQHSMVSNIHFVRDANHHQQIRDSIWVIEARERAKEAPSTDHDGIPEDDPSGLYYVGNYDRAEEA